MAKKNKQQLPFDSRGGKIVISRFMRNYYAYSSMSPPAKVLMDLLHEQWRNDRPVAYGVREAANKVHCSKDTASNAFRMLQERGFITCTDESLFNSKTGSKTREWRLTWLPFNSKSPTHEWEKWQPIN